MGMVQMKGFTLARLGTHQNTRRFPGTNEGVCPLRHAELWEKRATLCPALKCQVSAPQAPSWTVRPADETEIIGLTVADTREMQHVKRDPTGTANKSLSHEA